MLSIANEVDLLIFRCVHAYFHHHDLLAPNALLNMLPNRDEASKMKDLGADHLFIVRRVEVVNKPFDHLIFSHGGLHLCG